MYSGIPEFRGINIGLAEYNITAHGR